ncbi:MAG: acyl--CoA ligase [Proteobacteria bacterium]|nr:acyl--CoA ligase [Pseudomonadota bacterium]
MTIARIFEHARKTPDRIAIVNDGEPISYRDFARGILRAHAFLVQQNLPADGLVVVCVRNAVEAWCILLALASLGRVTAGVGRLTELKHFTAHRISCVIVRESEPRPILAEMATRLGFKPIRTPANFTGGADQQSTPEIPERVAGGHLVVTSGTTGMVKKVLIDAGNEAVNIHQRLEAFGIERNSIVNLFDWARRTSVGYTVPLGIWSIGASAVFTEKLKGHESLTRKGTTHVIATPHMVADLLAAHAGASRRQENLKLFVGGGPLPAATAEAALRDIAGHLFTMVGSTEAGVWCVTPVKQPQDAASHTIAPSRIVHVVDDEERPLPAGETGSVRIAVLKGTTSYYQDEEATRTFFRNGFFYPGDLGVFDASGRLTLQGRVTDIIQVNNMKFAVAPFERKLQTRLRTEDVCIFSAQTGGMDEELYVAVQGNPGFDAAALKAIAREELARFPHVIFRFVPEFPRNESGKVLRHELKEQVLSRQNG